MRTLVLGLGNELAGDDAVGVLVARAVREELEGEADVVESSASGMALIEVFAGREGRGAYRCDRCLPTRGVALAGATTTHDGGDMPAVSECDDSLLNDVTTFPVSDNHECIRSASRIVWTSRQVEGPPGKGTGPDRTRGFGAVTDGFGTARMYSVAFGKSSPVWKLDRNGTGD